MKRREFITLLGGATIASPVAAQAQQAAIPVVGLLTLGRPERTATFLAGLDQGLREAGFIPGQTVIIDHRYTGNDFDLIKSLAENLAQRRPAVIVASPRAAAAAKAATWPLEV